MEDNTNEAPVETPAEETAPTNEPTTQMAWPIEPMPLPGVFDVVPQEHEGQAFVVIATYTPAGATFAWTTRENALELSSRIRKVANTGPTKQETPKKSDLIIPGGNGKK